MTYDWVTGGARTDRESVSDSDSVASADGTACRGVNFPRKKLIPRVQIFGLVTGSYVHYLTVEVSSRSRRFEGDNAVNLPPSEVSVIPYDDSAT